MQVNLNGTFNVTRLAIPHLKQSAAGSIGFMKTLSRELGEFGIRANAILPGAVAGERIERVLAGRAQVSGKTVEDERRNAMSIQFLQQFVDPKDIAALAVFLASDSCKSISGQMLPIDSDMQMAS